MNDSSSKLSWGVAPRLGATHGDGALGRPKQDKGSTLGGTELGEAQHP